MCVKFQAVSAAEARVQMQAREGRLPRRLIACIGGGLECDGPCFHAFLMNPSVPDD